MSMLRLEFNFQIERNYGCRYLSMIPIKHSDDTGIQSLSYIITFYLLELINTGKDFMYYCMKSYLNSLKYRKEKYFKV